MIMQWWASLILMVSLQLGLTSRRVILSTGEETSCSVLCLTYVWPSIILVLFHPSYIDLDSRRARVMRYRSLEPAYVDQVRILTV